MTVDEINKRGFYFQGGRKTQLWEDCFVADFSKIKGWLANVEAISYVRSITPHGRIVEGILGGKDGWTDEGYFLVRMFPADHYPPNVNRWKKRPKHIRTYKSGKVVEINGDEDVRKAPWSHFEI